MTTPDDWLMWQFEHPARKVGVSAIRAMFDLLPDQELISPASWEPDPLNDDLLHWDDSPDFIRIMGGDT